MKFGHFTILVNDPDAARNFYIEKLGFVLEADRTLPGGYRWLSLVPPSNPETGIVLVLAESKSEKDAVGNQAGDRVLFTLKTDDCESDYQRLRQNGVIFESGVRVMPYGKDAVLKDLYGNRIDLVEVKKP